MHAEKNRNQIQTTLMPRLGHDAEGWKHQETNSLAPQINRLLASHLSYPSLQFLVLSPSPASILESLLGRNGAGAYTQASILESLLGLDGAGAYAQGERARRAYLPLPLRFLPALPPMSWLDELVAAAGGGDAGWLKSPRPPFETAPPKMGGWAGEWPGGRAGGRAGARAGGRAK